MKTFDLILTAAGSGSRFNTSTSTPVKKECILVGGRTVLESALLPFLEFDELRNIVVTYPEGGREKMEAALRSVAVPGGKILHYVQGGKNRTQSIRNASLYLISIGSTSSLTAVHDGARPFITKKLIESLLLDAEKYGAAAPGVGITDAVRTVDEGFITGTLDRGRLTRIQTPQIFDSEKFLGMYGKMSEDDSFQDDTEPYILMGEKCRVTPGDEKNTKITYRSDVEKNMRTGFGNDIHRLVEGRRLCLGGVVIPSPVGEEAHSDGDVLIHALIDAILGALAKGDIGHFFPPEDEKWKDADSRELLKAVLDTVEPEIVNVDSTVTLEKIKLQPYIPSIRESLALLLGIDMTRVSVKAKTNEGLDALGRGEAVKAEVVVLIES